MPEMPEIFRPYYMPERKEREVLNDKRRGSAQSRGYTTRWSKASKSRLAKHPLCVGCKRLGIITLATLTDHIAPHGGNMELFWDRNNWQSSCDWHHNVIKQKLEILWRAEEIGPVDLRLDSQAAFVMASFLQANGSVSMIGSLDGKSIMSKKLTIEAMNRRMPVDLKRSRIPVVMISGPAAAGKSTYVKAHRKAGDLVIDLDAIMQKLSGLREHETGVDYLVDALAERNRLLRSLCNDHDHDRAWFIISCPNAVERMIWQQNLGADLILLDTPQDECIRRIKADSARVNHVDRMILAVKEWWLINNSTKSEVGRGGQNR